MFTEDFLGLDKKIYNFFLINPKKIPTIIVTEIVVQFDLDSSTPRVTWELTDKPIKIV